MYTGFLITAVTAGHGESPLWAESGGTSRASSSAVKRIGPGTLRLAVRGQRAGLLTGREAAVVDGGDEADAVAVGAAGRRAQHVPRLRRVLVIGVALP